MAQIYSGGIVIATGFKISNPNPIADYMVVGLVNDLPSLPNQYVGMESFVIDKDTHYVKKSTGWVKSGGGASNLQEILEGGNTANLSIVLTDATFISQKIVSGINRYASIGYDSIKFQRDGVARTNVIINTNLMTSERTLELPNGNGTLVLSVNNILADTKGNIDISIPSLYIQEDVVRKNYVDSNTFTLPVNSRVTAVSKSGMPTDSYTVLNVGSTNTITYNGFLDVGDYLVVNLLMTNSTLVNDNKTDKGGYLGTAQDIVNMINTMNTTNFYVHTQVSPSQTWSFTHNLGRILPVTIIDTNGLTVQADVRYTSPNQITIYFNNSTAGKAYL